VNAWWYCETMRSVPPRGSGWVARLRISECGMRIQEMAVLILKSAIRNLHSAITETHPLPRGGTDFTGTATRVNAHRKDRNHPLTRGRTDFIGPNHIISTGGLKLQKRYFRVT